MLKKYCCFVLFLLLSAEAAGQYPDDEYYPYDSCGEEPSPRLETDSTLFYRAVQIPFDAYGEFTDFNLPDVAAKRRGQPYRMERVAADGAEVSWRYLQPLRQLGAVERSLAGIAPAEGVAGLTGGIRYLRFTDDMSLRPFYVSVGLADRNYLVRARFSAQTEAGRGWRLSAALDVRTGRDMHVEGVFTNALTAGFRISRRLGERGGLALTVVLPPSLRGVRASSSAEAFELTGDWLYNPVWGFQNGRVRSARVRREFVPLTLLTGGAVLSSATSFGVSLAAETGFRRYSSPGWYDARTPMPDNYRYLPGYTGDRETDRAWRAADPRYTQIDWDGMIACNRRSDGRAVYTLEDRAERVCDLRAQAGFETRVDSRLTLRYGVRLRFSDTRAFKRMRDLLGAEYLVDIDQYLIDDDTYGNLLQNDLRHPDRIVREGDRFGYDYTLSVRDAGVWFEAEYRSDRFRFGAIGELHGAVLFRRGHYEKELFPGAQSYGSSRRIRFSPYTFKALAGWAFSPRSYLELTAMAAASLPEAGDLFYQPQYNNCTVDDSRPERSLAAQIDYRLTGSRVNLSLSLFAGASFDGMQTLRYYDDMAGSYCDMAVVGIGRMACGAEAAADIRLSYRWSLAVAASAGRYVFIRDPQVTVISDTDNSVVDLRARSAMGGCATGGAPQLTGCAEVRYFGPKGWGVRASAGFAGRRYVEPVPLRRTARIARQGGLTPELFDRFVRQERLKDAFTVDASLFKSFYLGRSQLTASLILRNLAGFSDIPYDGYESLRVRRIRAGDRLFYTPHATRYTYMYPRSFYLTVSYRF